MPYYQVDYPWTGTFTSGDSAVFFSGGVASKCKVSSGAAVSIGLYGAASGTSVFSGGTLGFLDGCFSGDVNTVLSGGVLEIACGATVKSAVTNNGAILKLAMTGNYFGRQTTFNIASGGVAIKNTDNVSGFTGWDMKTSGCELEIFDYASAASVKVSSGCSLTVGSRAPYGAGAVGQIDVYNGGVANLYKADGVGLATVHSGGTMYLGDYSENTTVMENGGYLYVYDDRVLHADEYYDPNVKIKPNTFKDLVLSGYGHDATAHSGTVASHTTLKDSAYLEVFSGGRAVNTIVSGGYLTVRSGGVARDVSLETTKGLIRVSSGGKVTGRIILNGGTMTVDEGGMIDFDISKLSPNNSVLFTGYSKIPVNVGKPSLVLTVSGMQQAKGTYRLASEAWQISDKETDDEKTLSIYDASGAKLGAVLLGKKTLVGDLTYALNLGGAGDLTLTVAAYVDGEDIWTEKRGEPDGGWNDWLYEKKYGELNPEEKRFVSTPVAPSASPTEILFDNALAKTVDKVVYRNYVGEGDGKDFAKITLQNAARLCFDISASGAAKLTIWKLVPGKDDAYTMTSVQSVSAKKASKKAARYTATLETSPLESGEYYVSVETSAKKGKRSYYNVSVDQDRSLFYPKADNSDDWGDVKDNGAAGKVDDKTVGTLKSGKAELVSGGWVGCGDAADYMKFHLDTAANLVFRVNAGDASSFAIYKLNGPNKKEQYSLKSLLSVALSKNSLYGEEGEPAYRKTTKAILLEEGDYYLCVKSSNAKKNGDADYDILLDASSIFYDRIDDGKNNVLLEKKKLVGVCETISLGLTSKAVQMDKVAVNYGKWKNFVGHNDPADYAKITLTQDVNACFTVEANDTAKFTIYKLVGKADGKYSLKTVASKTLKKQKDGSYTAEIKGKLKKDDVLYLCMKSSNAKKGGNAYYNVTYDPVVHDKAALSGAEEDANAWGVVECAPANPVLTDADVLADSGIVTLSGADLADLQMNAAVDPAVSPIPTDASGNLFSGLLPDGNAPAETSASASLSRDDTPLRLATAGSLA